MTARVGRVLHEHVPAGRAGLAGCAGRRRRSFPRNLVFRYASSGEYEAEGEKGGRDATQTRCVLTSFPNRLINMGFVSVFDTPVDVATDPRWGRRLSVTIARRLDHVVDPRSD
jgi:hypothetical protein